MALNRTATLTEARSCLAALADRSTSLEASSAYERAIIDLDRLHGDQSPAHERIGSWLDAEFLLEAASNAIERLAAFGADALEIELILCALRDARAVELG